MGKECLHLGEHLSGILQHLLPAPRCLNLGRESSTIVSIQQTFTVAIIPTPGKLCHVRNIAYLGLGLFLML